MTEPHAETPVTDPHGHDRWNTLCHSMSEFLGSIENRSDTEAVRDPDPDRVTELMAAVTAVRAVESFTAWAQYEAIAALHTELVTTEPADHRLLDAHAQLGARIAMTGALTQTMGERLVDEAVALRDRLPRVALCLRDGLISKTHITTIVSRTDLIDGTAHAGPVDTEIAATLRRRPGAWSRGRLRDLCDRIVFRRDPDSIRRRRQHAHADRSIWLDTDRDHGMAALGATMSAEHARIAFEAMKNLAACACKDDPRRVAARRSDAMFALLTGQQFTCDCALPDCPALIPDAQTLPEAQARIVIHVVCDESTIDGSADNPGFMDGYGVIDADHVRDITGHPHIGIRPLVPAAKPAAGTDTATARGSDARRDTPLPTENDSTPLGTETRKFVGPPATTGERDRDESGTNTVSSPDFEAVKNGITPHDDDAGNRPLPSHLPSDPYRPSQALDTFVRIRDGYCTVPGCATPAWAVDLDHVTEYDHQHPELGGCTDPLGLNGKCRFHHLLKSFSHWVDDQYLDADGHLATVWYTPEGTRIDGPPENNTALFPGLNRVSFTPPTTGRPPHALNQPMRERTRTAAKHARRRHERELNRADRAVDPGFRRAHDTVDYSDYGPPPF